MWPALNAINAIKAEYPTPPKTTPVAYTPLDVARHQATRRVTTSEVQHRPMMASVVETSKGLPHRAAIDVGIGLLAGFSLSYFILPMDQAVMERMSGNTTLKQSLIRSGTSIVTNPLKYIRSPAYGFVFGTYAGTYITKNCIDTSCQATQQSAEATAFVKFWGVLAVNGGLSVFWKDPGLAKLFGNSAAAMPKSVYACWVVRDFLHMIGAVVVPDYCEQRFSWTKDQWRIAQVLCPMGVQLLTTPFHLMGLDLYNEPKAPLSQRLARIGRGWLPSTGIRCIRMFAPWSLGLLINRDLRDYLLSDRIAKPAITL